MSRDTFTNSARSCVNCALSLVRAFFAKTTNSFSGLDWASKSPFGVPTIIISPPSTWGGETGLDRGIFYLSLNFPLNFPPSLPPLLPRPFTGQFFMQCLNHFFEFRVIFIVEVRLPSFPIFDRQVFINDASL